MATQYPFFKSDAFEFGGVQPQAFSMHKILSSAKAERMEVAPYYADIQANFLKCKLFWKLERGQYFAEPGDDSWEAFNRGEWSHALQLIQQRIPDLKIYHRDLKAEGTQTFRARIVELPLTPYLQWEMHLLHARDLTGGPIHVINASAIAKYEIDEILPEIYTLDNFVMYQAVYDKKGVLDYVLKYTDPELIENCRQLITDLYESGVPIEAFFEREVAKLPPILTPGDLSINQDYLATKQQPTPIRS